MVEVAVYRPERSSLAGQEFTTIKHFQLKVEECLVLFLAFLCCFSSCISSNFNYQQIQQSCKWCDWEHSYVIVTMVYNP